MNDVLLNAKVPVNLKVMPAQVEILLKALSEIPYKMAHPLIESIVSQCQEQSVKPQETANSHDAAVN